MVKKTKKDKAPKARTHQNPKRHMPLVSLLLWHKMVVVHCFIWPLALQLWSDRPGQAGRLNFGDFLKILYPAVLSFFLFLMLYLMLDGLILFLNGDFCCIRCF